MLGEASRRLGQAGDDDRALPHLIWLAAAGDTEDAGRRVAPAARQATPTSASSPSHWRNSAT